MTVCSVAWCQRPPGPGRGGLCTAHYSKAVRDRYRGEVDGRPRALTLTGKARAALDAARRVTPEHLFTEAQLDAITKAGYGVYFVRAEPLLGLEAAS